jgi:hypothetical protein
MWLQSDARSGQAPRVDRQPSLPPPAPSAFNNLSASIYGRKLRSKKPADKSAEGRKAKAMSVAQLFKDGSAQERIDFVRLVTKEQHMQEADLQEVLDTMASTVSPMVSLYKNLNLNLTHSLSCDRAQDRNPCSHFM